VLVVRVQGQMEEAALRQVAERAAAEVSCVLDGALTQADFAAPPDGTRREALEALIEREVLRDQVVRVKIWNADGVVLYSDDSAIVGQHFPIQPFLRTALDGEAAYHVSSLDEEEEAHERAVYGRLME